MGSLTQVTIEFSTSHLIFPKLIAAVLALLGLAILATRRNAIAGAGTMWARCFATMDKPRFLGTLALTVAYFSAMRPVGDLWPNTGLGFLICSVPFVFLSGAIFMPHRSLRILWPLAVVAVIAPTTVWWLFSEVFYLTLP